MGNCLSFARLVIRGYGQPLYKRFHHRKMVAEIKRQYNERKNNLLATFGYKVLYNSCHDFLIPEVACTSRANQYMIVKFFLHVLLSNDLYFFP
jgi:hypothetical protein